MAQKHVILGASLAGATAAITLRAEGADGDVILIGAEPQPPYERPPLSKAYLRGEEPFDKALVRPATFYAEHGIQTMFGTRATRIDPSARAAPRQSSGFLGEPRSWRPQAVMVGRCDETRDPRAQDVCRGSGDRVDPRDGRGVRAECPDPNFETLLPKCLNRVSVDGSRTPQRGAQVAVSDWPWTA